MLTLLVDVRGWKVRTSKYMSSVDRLGMKLTACLKSPVVESMDRGRRLSR